MTTTVATAQMTEQEARDCVYKINQHLGSLRALLLDLYQRKGWLALGYESWRDCVTSEFEKKQSRVYQLLAAARVEQNLSTTVEIPERHLRPLAALAPDEQIAVWEVIKETAPNGKVTAQHAKSIANVFKEAMVTGAIDNGDGISIPIRGALYAAASDETTERAKRQTAHIEERTQNASKSRYTGQGVALRLEADTLHLQLKTGVWSEIEALLGKDVIIFIREATDG